MSKFTKEQNKRRYRLHRQAKKQGFCVHAWRRMVLITPEQELPPQLLS